MKASSMIESKYLKKEDLNYDTGNLVTIKSLDRQNVGLQDGEEDFKWIMHFREFPKGMVINSTNIQLTTKALGTDETDEWVGKKIVIYVDDNVSFNGKLVGGIRVRKMRVQAAQQQPEQPQQRTVQPRRDVLGPAAKTFDEEMSGEQPPW